MLKPGSNRVAALHYVDLGIQYLAQQEVNLAQQKLNRAYQLCQRCAEVHSAQAYFYEKTGAIGRAEHSHQVALRLAPRSAAIVSNWGNFSCRHRHYDEAAAAFQRALNQAQLPASEVYTDWALCAWSVSNEQQALELGLLAIKHDCNANRIRNILPQWWDTLQHRPNWDQSELKALVTEQQQILDQSSPD